ncbi:MAG: NADH:flavin oxidoreductase [Alphaproteobacteria bacterium]
MGQYDALLSPFKLKHLTLRNRVVSTAHAPAYDEDRKPKDRYQLYHAEKAKGGVGLVMFGGATGISYESEAGWGQLSAADETIVPYLRQFSERVHAHGAKLMIQLSHMGRKVRWDLAHWMVPLVPSHVPERMNYLYAKAFEDWDFERVIKAYGAAAGRCRDGGLDGVEICAFANHIFDQFWSPDVNRRTDRYGGSFENRIRFGLEALTEIRRVVGDDFVVGMRMSADELTEHGLTQQECLEIAKAYAKSGLVDFLNVAASQTYNNISHATITPSMSFPSAVFLPYASAIKAEVAIPIIHASRIADAATANRAIVEGHVDLVGMTRTHIADPHFVRKLQEGREDDIRQCVGAAYCIDRLYTGGGAVCTHNAATGREKTMPHVVPKATGAKRTIVVAGAGPGGLEAARVSAERGHRVILFEAAEKVGGQVNLAGRLGWREPMSGITRWLEGQVRKLGVDLRLGVEATTERVMAENPDIVIVATGGSPNKGRIGDSTLLATSWDVLGGAVKPAAGQSVLVYDDGGDTQGVVCAEFLAERGALVEFATPFKSHAERLGPNNRPIHMRNLYKLGAVLTPDLRLASVARDGNRLLAVLRNDYTNAEEERVVDHVVVEHGTLPREDLYFALKPHATNGGAVDQEALIAGRPQTIMRNPSGRFQLFRVGDAVMSRNIHAAIYDSLRLCKDF